MDHLQPTRQQDRIPPKHISRIHFKLKEKMLQIMSELDHSQQLLEKEFKITTQA